MTASTAQPYTDPAIVARAQAGDEAAFTTIFDEHRVPIWNYLYRVMGRFEDANDFLQDTFLKAWVALPHTSADLRIGPWLFRIAHNVCLDQLRHRKLIGWTPWNTYISTFHPSQMAKDCPERDVLDQEVRDEVRSVMGQLIPRGQRALELREYGALSYDEIAAAMGTTRAGIKTLLFRSRREFAYLWQTRQRQYREVSA